MVKRIRYNSTRPSVNEGIVPFHDEEVEKKAEGKRDRRRFRTGVQVRSTSSWTAQSMAARPRSAHLLAEEEGGTPLKRPTTVGQRRRKKEKRERARRNISNAPSSVAKIRFQASIARAHCSMRDVDGLVKPRLRGTPRENHGNRTKRR